MLTAYQSWRETPRESPRLSTKYCGLRLPTWALLAWNMAAALLGVYALVTINTADYHAAGCTDGLCWTAFQAGEFVAVGVGFAVWFAGFVALSLIWIMTWLAGHGEPLRETARVTPRPSPPLTRSVSSAILPPA
jgi:hypothetical protein